MRMGFGATALALVAASAGCFGPEERVVQPAGDSDARPPTGFDDAALPPPGDGGATGSCDLSGRWIEVQVTRATALGAAQKATNWFFHEISQDGDDFTITRSLSCGLKVTGTTTVTLSDATMEAIAKRASTSTGRTGSFAPTADGKCAFVLHRGYTLYGATPGPFLTDHWKNGDPDKELDSFPPLPASADEGMEDWDADGKEGITLSTGLGPRYVAQRHWTSEQGMVPQGFDDRFGGDGVVVVTYDAQEKVSTQTSPLLQTGSTPINPGYSHFLRVDERLEEVTTGAHPERDTCKNVVAIALTDLPNP